MWLELLPGILLVALVAFHLAEWSRIRAMEHTAERLDRRLHTLLVLTAYIARAALRGESPKDIEAFNNLIEKLHEDRVA